MATGNNGEFTSPSADLQDRQPGRTSRPNSANPGHSRASTNQARGPTRFLQVQSAHDLQRVDPHAPSPAHAAPLLPDPQSGTAPAPARARAASRTRLSSATCVAPLSSLGSRPGLRARPRDRPLALVAESFSLARADRYRLGVATRSQDRAGEIAGVFLALDDLDAVHEYVLDSDRVGVQATLVHR